MTLATSSGMSVSQRIVLSHALVITTRWRYKFHAVEPALIITVGDALGATAHVAFLSVACGLVTM